MCKPYYLVVAASKGYQPGLSALINSFRIHHKDMGIKMLIGDCDLEDEFKKQHNGDDIEYIPIASKHGHIWTTKFERFAIATRQKGAIVGIFDADMFVTNSMLNLWKMAEAGFIVGGSNSSNIRFGSNWDESYGMEVPNVFDTKTITSVPTFADIDLHGDVWSEIYRHKVDTNKGADFNLLNIMICKLGKLDQVIPIPGETMTGVHHTMVKCGTRSFFKEGHLLTENGLEVLCVHGRYWEANWYENLMKPISKFIARLGVRNRNSRAYQGAIQSRQLLKDEFDKYCQWPYDWSVKPETLANIAEQEALYLTATDGLDDENVKLIKQVETLTKQLKAAQENEIELDNEIEHIIEMACGEGLPEWKRKTSIKDRR